MTDYMKTLKQSGFLSLYSLLQEEDRLISNIRTCITVQDDFLKDLGYIPSFVPEDLAKAEKNLAETRSELRKYLKDLFAETV